MFNLIDSTLTLTARFWKIYFDFKPPIYARGWNILLWYVLVSTTFKLNN